MQPLPWPPVPSLQWHYNGRDCVSNHQRLDCLLNCLFRCRSKKTVLCHWHLWGESTGDRWISPTKGQWRGKCFHLMVSLCFRATSGANALALTILFMYSRNIPASEPKRLNYKLDTIRTNYISQAILHDVYISVSWDYFPSCLWHNL